MELLSTIAWVGIAFNVGMFVGGYLTHITYLKHGRDKRRKAKKGKVTNFKKYARVQDVYKGLFED